MLARRFSEVLPNLEIQKFEVLKYQDTDLASRVIVAMSSTRLPSSSIWNVCKPCRLRLYGAQSQFRKASSSAVEAATSTDDVVPESSHSVPLPSAEEIKAYDPIARARKRKHQLPPSR